MLISSYFAVFTLGSIAALSLVYFLRKILLPQPISKIASKSPEPAGQLEAFLKEKCIFPERELYEKTNKTVGVRELYEAYQSWADCRGLLKKDRLLRRAFDRALLLDGFTRTRGAQGFYWNNIGLLPSTTTPATSPSPAASQES